MVEAYIFDFDGVLVDTVNLHFQSWQKLAHSLGHNLPAEMEDKFRGASRDKSLQLVLDKINISAKQHEKITFLKQKNDWFTQSLNDISEDILLPGSKELLLELKHKNLKIGLASASKNAVNIINRLKLGKYFDVMVDGNEVIKSKPHPEVFLKVADKLGCKPENCIVFEDSPLGVEAAAKGGFRVIGVGNHTVLKNTDSNIADLSQFKLSMFSTFDE